MPECERLIVGGIGADGHMIDADPLQHVVDGIDEILDRRIESCGQKVDQ